MRAPSPIRLVAILAAAGVVGCQYMPQLPDFGSPKPAPPMAYVQDRGADFSPDRAWQHLVALTELGPRVKGTEGAAAARNYIRSQLDLLGVDVQEQVVSAEPIDPDESDALDEAPADATSDETDEVASDDVAAAGSVAGLRQIIATIPGPSEAFVILGAPYDTRHFESFDFVGANDGASGAAVLLELARVLAQRPLPYTTHIAFFEGEAPDGADEEPVLRFGSTAVAERLRADGYTDHIRLVVIFDRVCDADLVMARDLRSHRMYREEFWKTARRMGFGYAFAADSGFESVSGSHMSFLNAGMRRTVILTDTAFGGDESPGDHANSEDDNVEHCAADSLDVVGSVALEAIHTITRRLAKVDRVSPPAPLSSSEPSDDETEADVADAEGEDGAEEPEVDAPDENTAAADSAPEETDDGGATAEEAAE